MRFRIFFLFFFLISLLSFLFLKPTLSSVVAADLNYLNNKIGIHLATPAYEDLEKAAKLINTNGGDWGYVTLVMQEDDLNKEKWQGVFDQARKLHLIPIVRLATSFENSYWRAPKADEAQKWADFLDSLNWVVQNRFVVLFNEANRSDEWGGKVNPQEFAEVVFSFSKTLKSVNPDFFVMMAGFDSAAPSSPPQYEDEVIFLRKALSSQKNLFDYLDGWASHSYPNSFLPYGRNSIFNYQWELSLLKSLGINKNLPVFVTEAGWCHQEGKITNFSFLPAEEVAQLTNNYLIELLKDPQVIAVTPFILNYQEEPFDHFSWQKNNNEFYPQYEMVQEINKVKGQPPQEEKLTLLTPLPMKLIKNSTYQIGLIIRNEGQGFWDEQDDYSLKLKGLPEEASYFFSNLSTLMPLEEKPIWLYLKTGEGLGEKPLELVLTKGNKIIGNQIKWDLEIVPEININLKAKLLFKKNNKGDDFKFLIYNKNEEIVYSVPRFSLKNGEAEIKDVKNLIIGDEYRLVLIKSFYLPQQTFLKINENDNQAVFKILLPLDFNNDGKLSFSDLTALFKKPKLLRLWWLN
jgi:hypothetical protein